MARHDWETQPLAKLNANDRDAAYGTAVHAGENMKPMPRNAEQDRVILKGYREGLAARQTGNEIYERHEGGTIETHEHQKLADLTRYAAAMDRALEAAATMTPKEIIERASAEKHSATGKWHDINAKESCLMGSRGSSDAEFERWEAQDMTAKAWGRVSFHAETRMREEAAQARQAETQAAQNAARAQEIAAQAKREAASQEWTASLRSVTPRKAIDELDRYTPHALQQLQRQADTPGLRDEIHRLESGAVRRDASILKRLDNIPLTVSITADQTPLDRVRAIREAVEHRIEIMPKNNLYKAAETAVDRAAARPIVQSIEKAAGRFLARSESVPDANRTAERTR